MATRDPVRQKIENVLDEKSASATHGHGSTEDGGKRLDPDTKPVSFFTLFRYATKFELFLNIIGILAAGIAGVGQPVVSIIFGNLTNDFLKLQIAFRLTQVDGSVEQTEIAAAAFKHSVSSNAAKMTYIGIGVCACTFIYMYFWVYTGEINAKRIRERYLQSVLRQDIAYFDNVGAGEIATRIQTDTHLVQQGMSEKVALVIEYIASFLAGFIIALVRSWRLSLALCFMLISVSVTGAIMTHFVTKYMQRSHKHLAEGGTLAEEVISTVRTAKALGTQNVLSSLYDLHVNGSLRNDLKIGMWTGGGWAIFLFCQFGAYALAFNFGTTLINRGYGTSLDKVTPCASHRFQDDPATVVTSFLAILIGSFALAFLAPEIEAIASARAAATKLFETIERVPSIDSSDKGGLQPDQCHGTIDFENVGFSYPSRPDISVVRSLSISFPAGKTSALVGTSGSGKSTIIALIERFYDPLAGAVKLDGRDIKELNVKWLRSQIGLVSQEPVLFDTSVRGNVEHGLIGTPFEHVSEEKKFDLIQEACVRANAHEFISNLPRGYDTIVGERGILLSVGQKQRIAIARAIVSDPCVLLLDEATSALDTLSEGVVQNALDKASAGRTTIIIAHRLSTIKNADCIYVLENGSVVEQGSHEDLLLNEHGVYTHLVETQKLREAHEYPLGAIGSSSTLVEDVTITERIHTHAQFDHVRPIGPLGVGPSSSAQPSKKEKKDHTLVYIFRRLLSINRGLWPKYLIGTIAAIMTGMVYVAMGIVFAKGVDGFSAQDPHQRRHEGDRNALWYFLIAIISSVTMGTQLWFFRSSASELAAEVRKLCFRALLKQDVEYFDKDVNSTGKLTSDLSINPQKIDGLAGITISSIVQTLAVLFSAIIVCLIYSWKLGLVAIAAMPFSVTTGFIRLQIIILKDKINKKAHEESAQVACEAAGAIRTVASLTRERDCFEVYSRSLEEPLRESNRRSMYSHALFAASQGMIFFVLALIFWYGGQLVASQELSGFAFFVVLMGTTFGVIQAGNMLVYLPDVASAQSAATDVIDLLDSKPIVDTGDTVGRIPENVRGRIQLKNVQFQYPTRPNVRVLKNLSITVEPGTYVALVGASGCGKSTVIQLIERFYEPTFGSIHLDNEPINELNVAEYRKHIALVSQEPTLYAGTIRFNILLGATKPASEVSQEELEAACREANILDFIQSLPQGLDTEVGGKGSQLSGGQKQRIAIARALLRDPRVLLLDEATSALDSSSEKLVQEAIDKAAKGRTTIAIAHRLSTIQNADCIYFLENGVVRESGTHDQLLALRGSYYHFVQLQALNTLGQPN